MSKHSTTWTRDICTNNGVFDVDWEDECTVNYEAVGEYYPASQTGPACTPDFSILSVMDSRNEEVTDFLTDSEEKQIMDLIIREHGEMDDESPGEADFMYDDWAIREYEESK